MSATGNRYTWCFDRYGEALAKIFSGASILARSHVSQFYRCTSNRVRHHGGSSRRRNRQRSGQAGPCHPVFAVEAICGDHCRPTFAAAPSRMFQAAAACAWLKPRLPRFSLTCMERGASPFTGGGLSGGGWKQTRRDQQNQRQPQHADAHRMERIPAPTQLPPVGGRGLRLPTGHLVVDGHG